MFFDKIEQNIYSHNQAITAECLYFAVSKSTTDNVHILTCDEVRGNITVFAQRQGVHSPCTLGMVQFTVRMPKLDHTRTQIFALIPTYIS